ncbi:MAG TPA: LysE family transporter [bacterium]|nr:LysE family transporter [bacterium]
MEIAYFLISVFFVSLSGALMPGPVLAVVVRDAPRRPLAGFEAAAGHALLELPLVAAIALGFSALLRTPIAHAAVGAVGSAALVWMGISSLRVDSSALLPSGAGAPRSISSGLLASLNPYFFLWWATAGAAIVAKAVSWSMWVLALMYFAHVLVDFLWFGAVGLIVSRSMPLGGAWQLWLVRICGVFMAAFGVYFLLGAVAGVSGQSG